MALDNKFELLDSYLSNKLSGAEKTAFEQQLGADAELAREYRLQQQVVDGIRQARTLQLKTMLQGVAIPPAHVGVSVGVKALIGVTVAGLVATGLFFYLSPSEEAPAQEQIVTSESQPVQPQETEPEPDQKIDSALTPEPETKAENKSEPVTTVTTREAVTPKKTEAPTPKIVVAPRTKDSIAKSVQVFDPSEDSAAKAPERIVTEAPAKPAVAKSALIVKTDSKNKKYNFHYQFKNGELYLYGPFDKKLIDIMEFFGENKHTIFLYHENKYYLLSESSEKIKPLSAITDSALLKKLKENRNK
jgi:hypothetical protein